MKLWLKSTIALASTATVTGLAIGGVYIFNKKAKSANGAGYVAKYENVNGYPDVIDHREANGQIVFKSDAEIKATLKTWFYDQNEGFSTVQENYDAVNNTVNGKPYSEWRAGFVKAKNHPPVLTVMFGSAAFIDNYTDAVSPSDFVDYVVWFIKSVPWSNDMPALETFRIEPGVQMMGSNIELGAHAVYNKESTDIAFYPDGFFGSLPGYTQSAGFGNAQDNLLIKLTDSSGTLLTMDEIKLLAANADALSKHQDSGYKLKIRYIKPIEKITRVDENGVSHEEQGYEVYADAYKDVIDDVYKQYPYLLQEVEGYHVNDKGEVVYGTYKTVTPSTRIPFLSVMHVASPDFKSPGINFLKEVGAHEYGHHTTMQMAMDVSERNTGVYSGAVESIKGITPTSLFSLQMINNYLNARSHHLSATGTTVDEDPTAHVGEFIKWIENGKPEDYASIYGSDNPRNVHDALTSDERRAVQLYAQLEIAAERRGVSIFDLFIENSWDHRSGSVNPTYDSLTVEKDGTIGTAALAKVYETDADGKVQIGKLHFMTADYFRDSVLKTYNDQHQRVSFKFTQTDSHPIFLKTGSDDLVVIKNPDSKALEWQVVNGKDFVKATDAQIAARTSIVYNADGTKGLEDNAPIEKVYEAQQAIEKLVANIKTSYSINGWNDGDTVPVGQRGVVRQGSLDGSMFSAATLKAAGLTTGVLENGLRQFLQTSAAVVSSDPNAPADFANKETMNINLANEDLAKWFGERSTGTSFNPFKLGLGMYQVKSNTYGGGFGLFDMMSIGMPISAVTSSSAEKYGYSVLPLVNGVGTFMSTANGKYSIMPTSTFTLNEKPSLIGFVQDRILRDIPTQTTNPLKMVYVDDNNVKHDVFYKTKTFINNDKQEENDGIIGYPYYIENGKEVMVPAAAGATELPDGTFTEYKHISVEYDNARLARAFSDAQSKWGFQGVSQLRTDLNINSVGSFLDTFNVDPMKDFEFVTINPGTNKEHKISVIKKDALSKWFNFDAFKSANHYDDAKAQQILTEVIFNTNYLSMKESQIDVSKYSDEALFGKDSSLYAMLSTAGDKASLNSGDVVLPAALRFRAIELSELTDAKEIIRTIKEFKDSLTGTDAGLYGGDLISYSELSLFLGQQRYGALSSRVGNGLETRLLLAATTQIGPSQDIVNTLSERIDDRYMDKFSDYVYSLPEEINRDWLQITYLTDNDELDNVPSFANGVTEASTGFEYFLDGTPTQKYADGMVMTSSLATSIWNMVGLPNQADYPGLVLPDPKDWRYEGLRKISDERRQGGLVAVNWLGSNSFFGKSLSTTNGFFGDESNRRVIKNALYDDNGNPIIDSQAFRIKDFDGSEIHDRVRAAWVSYMKTNGVGAGTISGMWRSPSRDAQYLYGYVPYKTDAEKAAVDSITQLKFTDTATGEVKYLAVHTRQNNLHYFESRANGGTIHTLEQDGFTSWCSDFAPMGGYRDGLLKAGHSYQIDFADKNGNVVDKSVVSFNMNKDQHDDSIPQREFVCENGKLYGQASTWMRRQADGSVVLNINNQFNGN